MRQGDLWQDGVRLGVMMGRSRYPGSDDPEVQDGDYYGGKWGIHLRAPDLWFELLDDLWGQVYALGRYCRSPLRGQKRQRQLLFPHRSPATQCLAAHADPTEFEAAYGVPRQEVASGQVKLVRCGEGRGEIRPIEAKYLEPEVHNLMEIDGFTVSPKIAPA